jgi:hypothetical protein
MTTMMHLIRRRELMKLANLHDESDRFCLHWVWTHLYKVVGVDDTYISFDITYMKEILNPHINMRSAYCSSFVARYRFLISIM